MHIGSTLDSFLYSFSGWFSFKALLRHCWCWLGDSKPSKGNGEVNHAPQESIGECSSPSSRPWACRWRTTNVCDTWPVRCQTYGYLPSCKASPSIGWYQIILLGDRGTCVLTTCPGLHLTAGRLGFEPASYWSQDQQPTATPASHTIWPIKYFASAIPKVFVKFWGDPT